MIRLRPLTVANFLNYTNSGLYNGTIIHRVVDDPAPNQFAIMQGGGFGPTGAPIATPFGTVQNEPGLSNLRGTIAMAKLANDPNSATSQWFINDSDNTFLDSNDGGFTVFGITVISWHDGGRSDHPSSRQVDGTARSIRSSAVRCRCRIRSPMARYRSLRTWCRCRRYRCCPRSPFKRFPTSSAIANRWDFRK